MYSRPSTGPSTRAIVGGVVVLLVLFALAAGLVGLVLVARNGGIGETQASAPSSFAVDPRPAPPLALTDQAGRPFRLASLAGRPVLVFFGYTHCPDVCPETVGTLNEAVREAGDGPRVLFVSIDPDRDDVAAMASYVRYLPPVYYGLSGSPAAIRTAADAWGVKYAKVDEGDPTGYGMEHTSDVFLVDAQERMRAKFPFGTTAASIAATLRLLLAETAAPAATPIPAVAAEPSIPPSPAAQPTPAGSAPASAPPASAPPMSMPGMGGIRASLVSTSVWAGGASPVILTLTDGMGMPLDSPGTIQVQPIPPDGGAPLTPVTAVAVLPEGDAHPSWVATLDLPSSGRWTLRVTDAGGTTSDLDADVLDPGSSARLGQPAPNVATPTLADVGGDPLAVTTQPNPDLRLSQTSTADARAAGRPYVLVVDSARFRVSPACGRALTMIRYLLDRWPDVTFVHLEPFRYAVVTDEPVLQGDIANPPLTDVAAAWGLGDATWPSTKMPWVFVVDGSGVVRAKYEGLVGTADVDVILSQLAGKTVGG